MGFYSWLKGIGRKEQDRSTGFEVSRWRGAPPRRGTLETLNAFAEQPILQNIVDMISDNVAAMYLRAYKRVDNERRPVKDFSLRMAPFQTRQVELKALRDRGELVEVPDHPVLSLLADPNDMFTGRATWKLAQTHRDLVGETFLVMKRVANVPIGLWPIPATWVVQLPDYSLPRAEWIYKVAVPNQMRMTITTIPAADILHFRNPNPADPLARGVGIAMSLGDELDSDEYASKFVKNYFWNQAMPAGIAAIEGGSMTEDQKKQLKEVVNREHQGPEKAGKMIFTNGKLSFARLDTSFKDMNLVELRSKLGGFVRMTYRVPPEVIGDISNSNKATAFAAREILAEQVIQPRMEYWRTEFQKWLVPLFGDDIILDYDSPIPADRTHQLAVMGTFREAFTVNEARELAGQKPDPERGDEYLAPAPGSPSQPNGQAEPPTPDAGSAEGAAEEAKKAIPADPPWASEPLRAPLR